MSRPTLAALTVMELRPLGGSADRTVFFALRLSPPPWSSWNPGQFVMLRPANAGPERLWARPFSISHADSRELDIVFQAHGRATRAMAALTPGDRLDVWGPLGNSMAMEGDRPTLLLAGGIGVAPFVGYARAHPTPAQLRMEFGHRPPLDCYPFDAIKERIAAEAHHEQEPGDRERFITLVGERIRAFAANGLVLACGPLPFLKTVRAFASQYRARAQLCLENRMACGVGACLGCVVKSTAHSAPGKAEFVQTCTRGPNFWADSVQLD